MPTLAEMLGVDPSIAGTGSGDGSVWPPPHWDISPQPVDPYADDAPDPNEIQMPAEDARLAPSPMQPGLGIPAAAIDNATAATPPDYAGPVTLGFPHPPGAPVYDGPVTLGFPHPPMEPEDPYKDAHVLPTPDEVGDWLHKNLGLYKGPHESDPLPPEYAYGPDHDTIPDGLPDAYKGVEDYTDKELRNLPPERLAILSGENSIARQQAHDAKMLAATTQALKDTQSDHDAYVKAQAAAEDTRKQIEADAAKLADQN
ncbi:MAG TPA: hypothetical protein VG963_13035, partial [Polyangiaceae bacterium]|nr:hypothetical protein [Polyangiaceae bacterium]